MILIPKAKVYADCGWVTTSTSECQSHLGGSFLDLCCHVQDGCSSACGQIGWYDYCHDTGCKVYICYDESYCRSPYWWWSSPSGDHYALGDCAHEMAWI